MSDILRNCEMDKEIVMSEPRNPWTERKAEHSYRNEQGILIVGSQHVIDALRDDLATWKERAEKAEKRIAELEQDARRYYITRRYEWLGIEAIDAAIDTSESDPAESPNPTEPPQ